MLTTCSLIIFCTAGERIIPRAYVFSNIRCNKVFNGNGTHLSNTIHWELQPAEYFWADWYQYLQRSGYGKKGKQRPTFPRMQKPQRQNSQCGWSIRSRRFLVMFIHLLIKIWMLSREEETTHHNMLHFTFINKYIYMTKKTND